MLQLPIRPHLYNASIKRIKDLAGDGAGDDSSAVAAYLAESASAEPEFQQSIFRYIDESMPEDARKGLLFILNALKCVVPFMKQCHHAPYPNNLITQKHTSDNGNIAHEPARSFSLVTQPLSTHYRYGIGNRYL